MHLVARTTEPGLSDNVSFSRKILIGEQTMITEQTTAIIILLSLAIG
ncbi:hypothetical protein EC990815_1554 [Escherichia coli 99.0815]|uniref:Uncharacterized protein n=2 Tax=Escherichia coli TaxID=562 RepID=A0A8E0FMW6_ECOLX|nr:hypothetical protein ECH74115_2195 [Escherichia coli O157:H7 str. EC4115]AHG07787.1 hypothetical protein ECRM13514_1100 [Escherichia coli O145:H28 str. RM13514]AHY69613.1 hypothetical protein ECRM12581_5415 [Escherichia coli O145:H28 str. RM12581]AIG68233.1 hypothetical protein EDL933_2045 [Escherichia coli O157:H7 str. EDL933]AJA26017.1 hypothetical protein SS52_2141 [Escherichia coli O157:H7 str. SS52]ASL59477.1 hypothetical protein FORC44_2724 [Escherichia coli]EDU33887.1 hypothetical p